MFSISLIAFVSITAASLVVVYGAYRITRDRPRSSVPFDPWPSAAAIDRWRAEGRL